MICKGKLNLMLLTSSILMLVGFICASQTEPFSLEFKLINKSGKILRENPNSMQFCASVRLINKNHPTIEIYPHLNYGFKRDRGYYLEAYDLKDNEVEFGAYSDDPNWLLLDEKYITFSKGDFICDTIYSSLYEIKTKGVYKLRVVLYPDNGLIYNGKITSGIIYSNWDTLTIK
jgi:hypothetical protein